MLKRKWKMKNEMWGRTRGGGNINLWSPRFWLVEHTCQEDCNSPSLPLFKANHIRFFMHGKNNKWIKGSTICQTELSLVKTMIKGSCWGEGGGGETSQIKNENYFLFKNKLEKLKDQTWFIRLKQIHKIHSKQQNHSSIKCSSIYTKLASGTFYQTLLHFANFNYLNYYSAAKPWATPYFFVLYFKGARLSCIFKVLLNNTSLSFLKVFQSCSLDTECFFTHL